MSDLVTNITAVLRRFSLALVFLVTANIVLLNQFSSGPYAPFTAAGPLYFILMNAFFLAVGAVRLAESLGWSSGRAQFMSLFCLLPPSLGLAAWPWLGSDQAAEPVYYFAVCLFSGGLLLLAHLGPYLNPAKEPKDGWLLDHAYHKHGLFCLVGSLLAFLGLVLLGLTADWLLGLKLPYEFYPWAGVLALGFLGLPAWLAGTPNGRAAPADLEALQAQARYFRRPLRRQFLESRFDLSDRPPQQYYGGLSLFGLYRLESDPEPPAALEEGDGL